MEKKSEKNISNEFSKMVNEKNPESTLLKDCILAFVIGGLICDVRQFFMNLFLSYGVSSDDIGYYVAAVMVFLGAFLTGIGVYDDIAKFAGAGTVVPITGFANSIVAPAMEFKNEGYVFGIGGKMFVIAGPVLVYGVSSSVIVGLIYYFLMR